jgi:signal transduction histidine kinase
VNPLLGAHPSTGASGGSAARRSRTRSPRSRGEVAHLRDELETLKRHPLGPKSEKMPRIEKELREDAHGAEAKVALRQAVDEAISQVAARASSRRLSVHNEIPEGAVSVTDADRLRVVISNLLGNAVEYTAEMGQVVISSDLSHGLWLEVKDNGPRIPDEALPRLFDRFFRADPSRTATGDHHGLGLSVVQRMCAALGATVAAENRDDGWVAFTVRQVAPSSSERGSA